jgi:twinkle protein
MKFDFEAVVLSHLNSPDKSSKSHENGGRVLESQFTGSRALMRYSHMMFGFERNKQAQDPNCSIIRLLKNRKYGKTGTCKTYYEASTGRLTQRNWQDELYENRKVG